jgi:hypothetical protein
MTIFLFNIYISEHRTEDNNDYETEICQILV